MSDTISLTKSSVEIITAEEPSWLQDHRRNAWKMYESLPLPTKRDVDWQRFDLGPMQLDKVSLPVALRSVDSQLTQLPEELNKKGVVFCDLSTAVKQQGDLVKEYLGRVIAADEPRKFNALRAALWREGTFLFVPRGVQVTLPLEVLYRFHGEHVAAFPYTLVVVESGAEATLVQKFTGGPASGGNGVANIHAGGTEIFVGEGGRLHLISNQNFKSGVFDFSLKRALVGRDAEIDWVVGMFGGSLQRCDIECVMDGQGGTSFMYGLAFGEGTQQFGQFTKQHHKTGNTVSDLLFKNVFRDKARGNYEGMIKVEKNANETNAYQANRNLVLDNDVQCDTKPILEIESNELRCTHGATVGRLDEQQLFYLQSRGLTHPQSRQILLEAFLEPVLARVRVDSVREEMNQLIHSKVNRRSV